MYRFTAVPHVLLYGSTIDDVLFTAVERQMSRFEPSTPVLVLFFRFFPFFFWVGEWAMARTNGEKQNLKPTNRR